MSEITYSSIFSSLEIINHLKTTSLGPVLEKLQKFIESKESSLPITGVKAERVVWTRASSILGLKLIRSTSSLVKRFNEGSTISDTDVTIQDYIVLKGYLSFKGPSVETLARSYSTKVPAECLYTKTGRDLDGYHITLLSKNEINSIKDDLAKKEYYDEFIEDLSQIKNDWVVHGLGKIKKTNDECYFVVISWESADAFIAKRGFPPRDFHITLGYSHSDIHGCCKDASTVYYVLDD